MRWQSVSHCRLLFPTIHSLGFQLLERIDHNMCDKCVKLVGRIFVLVSLSVAAHTDTIRHVPDSLRPDGLVQLGVDSNIGRPHLLFSEFLDGFYGSRRAPFESHAMDVLVKMDGVLTSHHFFQRRASFLVALSRHLLDLLGTC